MVQAFDARMWRSIIFCLLAWSTACSDEGPADVQTWVGNKPLCIVTAFTPNQAKFGLLAAGNHRQYAQAHGYSSRAINGRISGELFVDPAHGDRTTLRGGGLYWQKLLAVRQLLEGSEALAPACHWVMWVDADVLFTNFSLSLEQLIVEAGGSLQPTTQPAAPDTQLILSKEELVAPVWLNAGVFLVKNSPQGNAFIDAIVACYPEYKDRGLPEQDAMQDLLAPEVHGTQVGATRFGARMLPQRRLNSFYNPAFAATPQVAWQPGDFVAHFVNTKPAQRQQRMLNLLEVMPSAYAPPPLKGRHAP